MQFVLLGLVALAAIVLIMRGLAGANPATVALVFKRTVGAIVVAISAFLALRGLLPIAAPLFLVGLGMLGVGGLLAGLGFPTSTPTPGNRSQVRTRMLAVELDHDTGDMDGEILAGRFAGGRLSGLAPADLVALREECATAGDQSLELIEAYLDRHHAGWRDAEGHRDHGAGAGGGQGSGAMDVAEARAILGVGPGASDSEIRAAHKKLMKLYHPDHGGSSYLAAKVNRAKDVLLGG
jgi:hypothetical protein